MKSNQADISIVIVNYKVKEYIANLLNSIYKAKRAYTLQIIVVDNNSEDNSIAYLRERYPEVIYIENKENVGFGKANNQGFDIATGKYTLVINPDTLVSEDTLECMMDYMEEHPSCGASGCKILNPDGTYAPESKRSVPTIGTAISKVFGLNYLFPKHKILGSYYLGWIDEDEIAEIPVLSGCFMFWRTSVLHQLNGFDERFFMYGEDIDLCYRIQETDFYIAYVPTTSIIHYKGESTRKGDLKYVKIFNKALYQFFDKHHSSNYSHLFRGVIFTAITLRAIFAFFANNLRLIGLIATDLVLLNISVILGFLIRFQFSLEVITNLQNLKHLWINVLASVLYVAIGSAIDLFRTQRSSISNQLKAVVGSFLAIAVVTFFVRDLAFSRLALLYGLAISIILMIGLRLIQINFSKSTTKVTGRIKRSKLLLVGDYSETEPLKKQIYAHPDWNYEVVGTVGIKEQHAKQVGVLPQLKDYVRAYKVDQVFFLLKCISYKAMLEQLSMLQNERVIVKLIPDSMDFILGKSNVEYLEKIPLIDVGLEYSKGINQWLKRGTELLLASLGLLILSPFVLPAILFSKAKKRKISGITFYDSITTHKWKNRYLLLWNVLIGNLHIVGAPLSDKKQNSLNYKQGITGLRQINESRISDDEDARNYELFYLQQYSIWMDFDILMKSMLSKFSILQYIEEQSSY
ncbi:MAG: glycosyltransferase [bacterium]|nr:glycosyltransferase [bacterium]